MNYTHDHTQGFILICSLFNTHKIMQKLYLINAKAPPPPFLFVLIEDGTSFPPKRLNDLMDCRKGFVNSGCKGFVKSIW